MLNHAFSVLYGRTGISSTGVRSGLVEQRASQEMVSALVSLRGHDEASAAVFAAEAVKILDGSTFRAVLWKHDTRMTLQPHELPGSSANSMDLVAKILAAPGNLLHRCVTVSEDIQRGHIESRADFEKAAAVLAGMVEWLTQESA